MGEAAARKLLYVRSERMCERCGMRRATNAHHRRAAGRVWEVANLLDLCGSGTTGCHGFVTSGEVALAKLYGWVVRREHNPLWTPVLLATRDGYRWCYLTAAGRRAIVKDSQMLPPVAGAYPDLPRIRA